MVTQTDDLCVKSAQLLCKKKKNKPLTENICGLFRLSE